MRIKLKKNPPGITGDPIVCARLNVQAGPEYDKAAKAYGTKMIGVVSLHIHTIDTADDLLLASLRLSPAESRHLAARLIESADTADRLLRGQS